MTPEGIAALLKSGEVAVVPTDTVYGIAASLSGDEAVRRIFELKGRPDVEAAARAGSRHGCAPTYRGVR